MYYKLTLATIKYILIGILNLIVNSSFSQKFESKDWKIFPEEELITLKLLSQRVLKLTNYYLILNGVTLPAIQVNSNVFDIV